MPYVWTKDKPPQKILAIRLQAMGDTIITLPYLQGLRDALPSATQIDFLTRREVASIPKALQLFDHVYEIAGGRNFKLQCLSTTTLLPRLLYNNYDAVFDLQNNRLSRIVRKIIHPEAWVEFDRFSPVSAGERNWQTIESMGLGSIRPNFNLSFKTAPNMQDLLLKNGWKEGAELVILNPAGAFENRNLPNEHYIEFAQLWKQAHPQTQFLMLGIDKIAEKVAVIKKALGKDVIDLVNKTNAAQAFALVQKAKLVVSEDSGLMHMSWVNDIPTLALFGSTRSDWARPLGPNSAFLDSSDMACGNCMQEVCTFQDSRKNACMIRYTAPFIFEQAQALIHKSNKRPSL